MQIKKILTAAFVAATLTGAGAAAANADPYHGGYGSHDIRADHRDVRDDRRDLRDDRRDLRMDRRFAAHDRIYRELGNRHIRFSGEPFYMHGRYVVRSWDRFGHASFVAFNPVTGAFIGFVRF